MSFLPLYGLQPAIAKDRFLTTQVPRLKDLNRPAITVKEWMAQMEVQSTATSVQVKGVKVEQTATGLDIILETQDSKSLQVDATKVRTEDNSLIADIPNAVLALPNTQEFSADNPTKEIANVRITQLDATQIRITVVGKNALPTQEVTLKAGNLAYNLNPKADEPDEEIEIVVTGEEQGLYRVPNASTATKIDTPLRDIPQSIQVVPQQVLEDRNVTTLNQAVETVSGVADGGDNGGAPGGGRIIRGFRQDGNFRNGFRDVDFFGLTGVGTIEQVEVLKGPASVLFGAVEPGGIINVITKQPLSEPFYKLAFEAGNFGYYQPSIDFSGPLNGNKTVLYRFIASYQASDSFQDFVKTDLATIAPSITFKLGERTTLNLYYEYTSFNGNPPEFFTGVFSDGSFLPQSFVPGYPDFNFIEATTQKFGYTLNQQFGNNWQIRNNFAVASTKTQDAFATGINLVDDRFLEIAAEKREYSIDNYFGQIDVLGKFKTGAISHQLLVGFDFNRFVQTFETNVAEPAFPNLNIFNPNFFNIPEPVYIPSFSNDIFTQSYGVYLQDQSSLLDNVKLLIGGRLDWVSRNVNNDGIDDPEQNDNAFSPRIGLVYQPSQSVSLYTSYSQSFNSSAGFNPDGRAFKPTKGTQFETGIKADFLDGKLSTTLAAYQLTKTNVTTPDPNNIGFSIQVGEQRSRGIELDIAGEILPGWKAIASYAYTDAEVTEDNAIPVGNRLLNVPKNQASLWTTYEIQKGALQGLGFGLGLFYVGDRAAFSDNSFDLPNYLRTDAAIYYRINRFNAAINIRNLFNTDYFRTSYDYSFGFQRGAPFTIIGSISWEF